MVDSSELAEEGDRRDMMLADKRIRFIRTDVAVVQLFRVRHGVRDRWLATVFRLHTAQPIIRTNYAEREWLLPNHSYLIAEARYFLENQGMTRQLVMCGDFELEGRTVRAYRERYSKAARLWLKRIKPAPEVGLGYAEALDTDRPQFHPLNSIWTEELRNKAAASAAALWAGLEPDDRGSEPGLSASARD